MTSRDVRLRSMEWIGPLEADLKKDGVSLHEPVPPERWPYGPLLAHEDGCYLHRLGLYCDCAASAADGAEYGIQP